MSVKKDRAGVETHVGNPLTKEGVFLYSGKVIDPQGILKNEDGTPLLDRDKLYPVYRPASEIGSKKTLASFEAKPLINEHIMLGDGEGMTPFDSVPHGGAIKNVRVDSTDKGRVICDLDIYGKEVKELIKSGKRELSLGYFCKYRKESGTFNGQNYEFVQYDIEGNHVALVERGRMGSDVRVFDSLTFDSMEITPMNKNGEGGDTATTTTTDNGEGATTTTTATTTATTTDKGEGVRGEIAEMLKTADEKTLAKVKKFISDSCGGKGGKDGDEGKGKDGDEGKGKGKDSATGDEAEPATPATTTATAVDMKEIVKNISRRDNLYKEVEPLVGSFDHDEMLAEDVAAYACDKLEIAHEAGQAEATLRGFLAGRAKAHSEKPASHTADAVEDSGFESAYLKPNK